MPGVKKDDEIQKRKNLPAVHQQYNSKDEFLGFLRHYNIDINQLSEEERIENNRINASIPSMLSKIPFDEKTGIEINLEIETETTYECVAGFFQVAGRLDHRIPAKKREIVRNDRMRFANELGFCLEEAAACKTRRASKSNATYGNQTDNQLKANKSSSNNTSELQSYKILYEESCEDTIQFIDETAIFSERIIRKSPPVKLPVNYFYRESNVSTATKLPVKYVGKKQNGSTPVKLPVKYIGKEQNGSNLAKLPVKYVGKEQNGSSPSNLPVKYIGKEQNGSSPSNLPVKYIGKEQNGSSPSNLPGKYIGKEQNGSIPAKLPVKFVGKEQNGSNPEKISVKYVGKKTNISTPAKPPAKYIAKEQNRSSPTKLPVKYIGKEQNGSISTKFPVKYIGKEQNGPATPTKLPVKYVSKEQNGTAHAKPPVKYFGIFGKEQNGSTSTNLPVKHTGKEQNGSTSANVPMKHIGKEKIVSNESNHQIITRRPGIGEQSVKEAGKVQHKPVRVLFDDGQDFSLYMNKR